MNEQDLARSLTRHLSAGLDALPPSVLYRLRAARAAALARVQQPPTLAGGAGRGTAGRRTAIVRRLAPATLLLLLAGAVVVWQQQVRHAGPAEQADLADVDTQVLTDDLPVVAYLDPGFEIWLYHHSPATAED